MHRGPKLRQFHEWAVTVVDLAHRGAMKASSYMSKNSWACVSCFLKDFPKLSYKIKVSRPQSLLLHQMSRNSQAFYFGLLCIPYIFLTVFLLVIWYIHIKCHYTKQQFFGGLILLSHSSHHHNSLFILRHDSRKVTLQKDECPSGQDEGAAED